MSFLYWSISPSFAAMSFSKASSCSFSFLQLRSLSVTLFCNVIVVDARWGYIKNKKKVSHGSDSRLKTSVLILGGYLFFFHIGLRIFYLRQHNKQRVLSGVNFHKILNDTMLQKLHCYSNVLHELEWSWTILYRNDVKYPNTIFFLNCRTFWRFGRSFAFKKTKVSLTWHIAQIHISKHLIQPQLLWNQLCQFALQLLKHKQASTLNGFFWLSQKKQSSEFISNKNVHYDKKRKYTVG